MSYKPFEYEGKMHYPALPRDNSVCTNCAYDNIACTAFRGAAINANPPKRTSCTNIIWQVGKKSARQLHHLQADDMIPEGYKLKVIRYGNPYEYDACKKCPLVKICVEAFCTKAAENAGLANPKGYYFVNKIDYITWRLTK